jgi:hypothetical protein
VPCVVCNDPRAWPSRSHPIRYECPRCGVFVLDRAVDDDLPEILRTATIRRALMSHALRRMQRPNMNRVHIITHEELPSYWKAERLPTPQQQADNLILWIGDHQVSPESYVNDTWAAKKLGIAAGQGSLQRGISDQADVRVGSL